MNKRLQALARPCSGLVGDAAGGRWRRDNDLPVHGPGVNRGSSGRAVCLLAFCASRLRGAQREYSDEREKKARADAEPVAAKPHRTSIAVDQSSRIGRAAHLQRRQVLSSGVGPERPYPVTVVTKDAQGRPAGRARECQTVRAVFRRLLVLSLRRFSAIVCLFRAISAFHRAISSAWAALRSASMIGASRSALFARDRALASLWQSRHHELRPSPELRLSGNPPGGFCCPQ